MLIPAVDEALRQRQFKSVLLTGIEAHVCVQQTCLDLLARGYDVHVIEDAVSSSNPFERISGINVRTSSHTPANEQARK
jgi:nicotinamidase-related amidase